MLRLRFPEPVPDLVSNDVPFRLRVWCTNENGSTIRLAKALTVDISVVSLTSSGEITPLAGVSLVGGGGGRRQVVINTNGSFDEEVSLKFPAELPSCSQFRILLHAPAEPAMIAGWTAEPFKVAKASSASSFGTPVRVMSIISSPFTVTGRVGASLAHARPAAHERAVGGDLEAAAEMCLLPGKVLQLQMAEQHMRIMPGFGSICWDAAIIMSSFLQANRALVCSKRCVDIGTGTGLVGISAAALGAHVALTDVAEMLPLAIHNAALNHRGIVAACGVTEACELPWGEVNRVAPAAVDRAGAGTSASTKGAKAPPMVRASADGVMQVRTPVDVVFASEVAYRNEVFPLLLATFLGLMGMPTCSTPGVEAATSGLTAVNASAGLDASSELSTAAYVSTIPPFGDTPVTYPCIVLGARERACCDIADFLRLLSTRFLCFRLQPGGIARIGAAEAGGGGKKRKGHGKGIAPSGALNLADPDLCDMVAAARSMSKTGWEPMLFILFPKSREP